MSEPAGNDSPFCSPLRRTRPQSGGRRMRVAPGILPLSVLSVVSPEVPHPVRMTRSQKSDRGTPHPAADDWIRRLLPAFLQILQAAHGNPQRVAPWLPDEVAAADCQHGTVLMNRRLLLAICLPLLLPAAPAPAGARGPETSSAASAAAESRMAREPLIIFVGADRDIGKLGQVPELAGRFRRCGYSAVYLDPWKQSDDALLLSAWIRDAVRRQRRRVMIVGWSYGAVVGLKALRTVAREGIRIDTFVELDCFFLSHHVGSRRQATNARRIVVIRSGLNGPPRHYRRPVLHRLATKRHLVVPTLRYTQQVLFGEANRLRQLEHQEALARSEAAARAAAETTATDPD